LSYLRSLQRHTAMEYGGEVRSVVALKPGVGDHTPERIANHEPREMLTTGPLSGEWAMDWKTVKRLYALT
jgi:hypothetical protein